MDGDATRDFLPGEFTVPLGTIADAILGYSEIFLWILTPKDCGDSYGRTL
jgi:hypothetical protein